MKEDLGPRPDRPPKSKRQLAQLPDVWIAEWLASDTIMPGDRKKLETIKEERKHRHPDVKLAILLGPEGMTPEQFRTFQRMIPSMNATEIHHTRLPGKLYRVIKEQGVPSIMYDDFGGGIQDMIRDSTVAIAFPKETTRQPYSTRRSVWSDIGYAVHRSMPVKVIMPDGREQ